MHTIGSRKFKFIALGDVDHHKVKVKTPIPHMQVQHYMAHTPDLRDALAVEYGELTCTCSVCLAGAQR